MFNRPISFVRWHLGALINICYMWFSKGGAEISLGTATIHLAPPGPIRAVVHKYLLRELLQRLG